jgi:L-threonylcarbamoyladenylate synthase
VHQDFTPGSGCQNKPVKLLSILGSNESERAASLLQQGGLVALPTETVYGLGAAINQPAAIARIFKVKGRPVDHPLIVHVSDWEMAKPLIAGPLAAYVPALVRAFSPGPITFIVPKSDVVSEAITGGQDSVGIRIPRHPLTQSIIRTLGCAVAAPSANLFGEVSPTSAIHVFNDLKDILDSETDAIVDGGECEIGLESTIVDCRFEIPRILRPGAITKEMISAVVASVQSDVNSQLRVSGSLEKHYSPRARVRIIDDIAEFPLDSTLTGFIALERYQTPPQAIRLAMPRNESEFAQILYEALRKADDLNLGEVIIVAPENTGLGIAIRDRISRAAN